MKSYFQKISKILILFISLFAGWTVYAEASPASLRMTHYTQSNTPISFPANFHVKKTVDGKYAYCVYYSKSMPVSSINYTKGSLITDSGMNYILNESMKAQNDNSYFVYQTALWSYMVEKGLMPGAYYDITVFRSRVNSSNTAAASRIKTLVNNAKNASSNTVSEPTIKIDTSTAKFVHSDADDMYILSPISVISSTGKYKVSLNEAPKGTVVRVVNGNQLEIVVPSKNITGLSTKLSFSVSNSVTQYTSYYYHPSNDKYQIMALTYPETKTSSVSKTVTLIRNKSIDVDKVDENGKSISGAKLQVLDNKGNVVDTWTTDGKKHTISKLKQGTYSVVELVAPSGYVLNAGKFIFTVNDDGMIVDSNNQPINLIKIKNTKTAVKISKQDIVSKQELLGATLAIKNADGQEVVSWMSSDRPHIIKGLSVGTYTLYEKVAPNGYDLSNKTIEFQIDQYGKLYDMDGNVISGIVMFNQQTNKRVCQFVDGKYYGKDGSVVLEKDFKDQCEKKSQTIINKIDSSTGKNLAGATLVVRDYSGSVIDTWVSTSSAHTIEGLRPGIYTLSEKVAPNGYALNTESVTFTVKKIDSITNVVMYNTKEVKKVVPTSMSNTPLKQEVVVDNTASFKTIASSIFGIILTFIGIVIMAVCSKSKKRNDI